MASEITIRQQEIIEAAGKILTDSGVGGLTIKNLAKEMKFTESALYRHFKSKEEIIICMLEYLATNMDERLASDIHGIKDEEEKFRALLNSQFVWFKNNPHFLVAVFCDGLMEESKRINQTIIKIMEVKMKHLMPIIKEGQHRKVFTSAINAEQLVHIIMGTFRLQMFKWRMANFEFDIKKSGEKMIQSLLILIKNK